MKTTGDFSDQAHAYARSRPGYPPELLDAMIARAGVREGDLVADIGAGTGIFTRMLAERGFRVRAIDPTPAMREQAQLGEGVEYTEGSFEDTGLAAESVDWVTAAQSFHWADAAKSLPEVRRILRPGACFTIFWNDRRNDESPVLQWLTDYLDREVPEWVEGYRKLDPPSLLVSTGDFEEVRTDEATHVVEMDRARFVTLWRSHRRLRVGAGKEGVERLIRALETHLDETGIERIDVPYVCRAWTATRVS